MLASNGKKCYELLVGKPNEPKLKNISIVDMYVVVGCRETSLIEPKQFMTTVVTPHEVMMALKSDMFPWEGKVITDFNELLDKLGEPEYVENTELVEESKALVKAEHRELVAVYSAQVLNKYEQLTYKGLDLAT